MTKERDEMINKDRICLLGVPCVIIGLNLGLIYGALLALFCVPDLIVSCDFLLVSPLGEEEQETRGE